MLTPTPFDLFFNRQDPTDPRLGELIKRNTEPALTEISLKNQQIAILGYPDDQGITLNKGRVGAAKAPDMIRKYFYRLTQGIHHELDDLRIIDIGNLSVRSMIKESHEYAAQVIREIRNQKVVPIVLGGGNDYAFADVMGMVLSMAPKQKLGIINIDAHFDVRDLSFGITSGTPYYRVLETYGKRIPKNCFVEFAIQSQKSSKQHFQYVAKKGGKVHLLEDLQNKGVEKTFKTMLKDLEKKCDAIVVSLDMDSVRQADAPGVSAPSSNGLSAKQVESISNFCGLSKKVKLFSIYEVSPPLDRDDQTSRLAANCMWAFLSGFARRP